MLRQFAQEYSKGPRGIADELYCGLNRVEDAQKERVRTLRRAEALWMKSIRSIATDSGQVDQHSQ